MPRGGYRAARESLEIALRVLDDGWAFGISPLRFAPPADGRLEPARRRATDEIMAAIARLSGQAVAGELNELSAG